MQPTDQTSIADVYSEQLRSNSGALYHLVTTYSVIKSVSDVVLAKPKSPILRSQFPFKSKLLGLRSRCKTFAECTYFSPLNSWYRKYCRIHEISICKLILKGKTQVKTSCCENETMSLKFNNTFLICYDSRTISTVWLISILQCRSKTKCGLFDKDWKI